jgi:hypothetical protein
MYYINFTVGENEYKLRMNIRATMALEKQLGCNPLAIFGDGDTLPTITAMIHILHASLQDMHHGISFDAASKIFETWLREDNAPTDFIPIIIEIYKASGIIKPDTEVKNV